MITTTAINGEFLSSSPENKHLRILGTKVHSECPPPSVPQLCHCFLHLCGPEEAAEPQQVAKQNPWPSGSPMAPPTCPTCPSLDLRGPSPTPADLSLCPGWGWASFSLSSNKRPISGARPKLGPLILGAGLPPAPGSFLPGAATPSV